MDNNNRIVALDVLKAFAIFIVVWGHVIQFGLTTECYDEPIYKFIYTFHMPLFMVLCGYFSWNSMRLSWWGVFKKKFISLIVPCISWGVVTYALLFGTHLLKNKPGGGILELLSLIWSDYWFLKATFICYILAWGCYNIILPRFLSVLFLCIISQLFQIFNVPVMFPCFLLGMFVKKVIDRKWFVQLIPGYIFLFLLLLMLYKREYYDGTIEASCLGLDIFSFRYLMIILVRSYKFLLGASAALFFLAICRKYMWNYNKVMCRINDFILQCGMSSLGIYLLHTLFVTYLMQNLIHFDNLDSLLFNILISPIVALAITITCLIMIKVINKNRRLSLLLFGTNYI